MLIIKTKMFFIKKCKKTKYGKKSYKQKKFITLQNGDIITPIKSIKITKLKKHIKKPMYNENSFGWNQDLQELFKVYPPLPIPIKVEENLPQPYNKLWGNISTKHNNDETSCLNHFLIKYAEYKLTNNEIPDDKKDDVISMVYKFHQKVNEKRIKDMFTGIIISLDWDDVMYHLMQKNIEFVEKEYGVKDVHLEITDYYYLYRTYPKIADELWNHPENYISGELVDGAKEFYQELVDLVGEDKIQIVTSSMENVIPLKDKMLKEKFGINCKIVHSIFGKHKKYEFTKNTLLIDDFVGNIREHFIHNLNHGIIFNHMNLEYIKKECDQEGFLHVTTFKDIIEKVKLYLEYVKK